MLKQKPKIDPLPSWKRCFDLSGACVGLAILSPLLITISIYIKLASRGPVFFKHKRYGYMGKPLYVWKFRSMHVNANPTDHQQHVLSMVDNEVELKKLNTDAQLIPLGKWLRCSALDELPQLINVFKGEMSLVGPRPDVVPVEQYNSRHQTRFDVLPGLTGLWQVSGKNHTTFNEMKELDARYVEERSIWLDLRIVLWTVPAILKQVAEDFLNKQNDHPDEPPMESTS